MAISVPWRVCWAEESAQERNKDSSTLLDVTEDSELF